MNRGVSYAATFVAISAALLVSACAGGGGSPTASGTPPAAASTTAPGRTARTANVSFTIRWPATGANAGAGTTARRKAHRAYLSPSTASVTIAVNGGTPLVVNDPNLATGATSGTETTTVSIAAPVGPDTFLVKDFDSATNLLAANSIPYTVVIDNANVVTVTLNGNLAKIVCAPEAPFVTGSPSAFTLVGPTGQIALEPEDADGNIIIAPGTIPNLSFAPAVPADATIGVASTPNEFNVNVLVTGALVALTASGNDLAGDPVPSATCNITREEALYVANQGVYGTADSSVTIYPATASGAATPTATIAGANTDLVEAQFVTVDPRGYVFVSNQGPMPGATYGPAAGYISIYAPGSGQNGNASPVATIPNLNTPEGVAFDANNNLYVMTIDRILKYPASADGETAPAVASATIAGSNTNLYGQYGLSLDLSGLIYTAGVNNILSQGQALLFPAGSNGNVTPIAIEPTGSQVSTTSESWLGIAPDATGSFYTTASNNNLNLVVGYGAQTASGTPVPSLLATGFDQPSGIFIDIFGASPTGGVWVANYAGDSVDYFSSTTALTLGAAAATSTLSGTGTGLNTPFGVYVR